MACFLCGGPHKSPECPHRSKLAALQAQIAAEGQQGQIEECSEDEEETMRMGAIRLLCDLKKQGVDAKKAPDKGLMFIDASLNGRAAKSVMVDTGATHN